MKTKQFSLFILFAATALTNAFAQNAPTSELTTGSISGGEFNVVTVDRPVPKASAATAALSNTYVPNTVTIDANKAVGEIPFTSGIAQNGAMTYNVPIEVYPGIKGMQPQLAIAYNHLSGNGLLGVGWSLSGLSSISRTVKSIYYDGASNGVSLSKDDAFVLDGMRLIKTGESTSQITYESEQGYIKATAFLNGNIVKYFEVYYPSGRKGIYGYTGNTVNKLQYPLTSLTDLYGNAVTYTYTEANNRYLPTKIAYSGASVEFAYEGRSETPIAYNAGLKIKEDKRLKYINCKLGGATLRTYSLTYIIQKNSSALSQVDLAASGKSLNPLKFWYGENNNAYKFTKGTTQLISWYNFSDKNALYTKIGKFDPDNGIEDNDDGVITFPVKNSYYRHHRDSHWYQHSQDRYDNYYDGTESIFFHTGLTSTFAGPMPSTQTEKNFIDVICANLDGVYGDEVIKINNGVSGNYDQVIFKAYQSNIYNGLALKYTRTFNFSTVLTDNDGGKSIHPKFYFPGDFNGDGKTEILAVSCNNPLERTDVTSQCYIFDLEANKVYSLGYIFPYKVFGNDAENMDKLYVMDYDGDGKSDICLVNSSGIQTYKFTGSGSTYSLNLVSTYTGMTKNSLLSGGAIFRTLLLGEFNGDGKPDLLLAPLLETDNTCYIYYGMGNGQYEKTSCQSANGAADVSFLLQDVNGDGLTDLIKGLNDRFYIYLAANGVLSSAYDGNTYTGMTKQSIIIPVNINNGEYFTRLLTLKDGIMTRYSYPRSDTKEKLLTGVASSLGVVIKNYYQSLYSNYYNPGNFESVYIKGSGAVFPYENGISFMFFPSATAQYFNGKINENRHYIYQNAVVHKQGLGFRGFERIISYDEIRDRSATQTFDPYNFGILKADESVFAKNTYVYSVSVASNKIAKIRMTSLTSQDKVKGTTATTTFSYDAYGNPTTQKVNYGDGITETLSTTYYNNTALTGYLLGFPTDRTKTVSRNGSSYKEREYIAAHDNKGSPLNKTRYYNSYQTAYEEYTYDAKGNCTQVVHKDYSSPASQTTKYTFDSYGRVTSEINPLNLKTSYQYNGTGLVSKITNCYNKARTYTYDEFGRNTQTTNFDGTIASTAYTWDKAGTNGLFRIMSSATEQPTQKTYYDALGRETRKSVTLFDGRESHIDKIYYTVGLLQKVSRSFYNYGSYWDEYSYDDYDQVSSVKEPTGRMTRYSYDGKNITVVKDGVSSTQYYDAQGNLISVSDPAGTITYNLRPDGQPTSIVAPDNVTTSFTYDSYGRQLKIIDPSAGTRTYTYDAAGNIASEKNANGKTITYAYDAYNRLTTKTSPEFTTTYVYDAYGRQTSESSTNGCSVAYTYDAYGRVATVNETVTDGKFLKRTFTYQNGKIASVKYDTNGGNITTENYSYQNGYPLEIKAGTTSFWRMYEVNVYGQPRYVVTGNFTRSYAYDVYGTPTSRTAGSFQNFSYSFDATKGNLTYRKDNKKNIQENFTYDNLNRLTGFAGKSTAYDVKGNITAMSDAGTFSYSVSGKPYAVSNIQSATALVPQRNQTVTYTSFQRPATITENGYSATFTYNGSNERVKMELKKDGQKELTKYYISQNIEIDDRNVGGLKEKLYLGGDFYTAAAVYVRENGGAWQLYYICRDYLGSITHLTNSAGAVVQELSYDAWGRLRNPANQQAYTQGQEPELFLGRGYTGHEHLAQFGLVNMNARLYDPAVGRFLSPDPYVQNPLFSQNYNRYSYVLNNPLRYTDPTGEVFWILPNVSWSKGGGMSFGISVGVGFPGGLSVQAGIGYGTKSAFYAYVGASAAYNTVYASYSYRGGFSAGWTAGMSIYTGFSISTNFLTVGANYNITNDAWSGNVSAWSIDNTGVHFNPSVSAVFLDQQTTNFVRGQGFKNNDAVLAKFVANGQQQEALDYFGFKGYYAPNSPKFKDNASDALFDPGSGLILYNNNSFLHGYDYLRASFVEEQFHSKDYLKAKKIAPDNVVDLVAFEEWRAQNYMYRNQGLYLNSGNDWVDRINYWGNQAGIYSMYEGTGFKFQLWHYIYKIPRLW